MTANIQTRALNAWITIPEDYLKKSQESLAKRVQAVVMNNDDHAKYGLSSLDLYKLFFLAKQKETSGVSRRFAQHCMFHSAVLK